MITKKSLSPIYDLKQVLRNLHNHLYGGGPVKTEARLAEEVARIVLCKLADELAPNAMCDFYALPNELKTDAGREKIFQRILALQARYNGHHETEFQIGSYWVAEVVNTLQPFALLSAKSYVSPLADVYEVFSSGEFKGGRGQFFTPPVVVNLAYELLDTTESDFVIDPACGSGNFLSKVMTKFCAPDSSFQIADSARRQEFVQTRIFGRDIETGLIRLAREYLELIAGSPIENVAVGDSLDLSAPHYRNVPVGKFTRVFTNPPFGNNIEVTNPSLLSQFDLGHVLENGKATGQLVKGQHPDRLFLELCVKLLTDGGRCAIVLPRQILSGDEANSIEIRKWLLQNVTLLAVIDLPAETFQPYTGTITSLLVFEKGAHTAQDIFFGICEAVGHDRRGLPLYDMDAEGNVLRDERRQPKLRDDTTHVIAAWKMFQQSGSLATQEPLGFSAPLERVANHPLTVLNAWAYNPSASDAYQRVMALASSKEMEAIVPLKELCREIFVPGRHKRKYVPASDASIPFLSTTQIFHIHDIDHKFQPMSFAVEQGLLVEEGWILVTRSGSTGRVRYVNRELSRYAISDHCIRIVPDETRVDSGYLYAFLSSSIGQLLIDQGRYASVIETISHTRLGEIPIPLPVRTKQKEIGDKVRDAEQALALATETRQQAIDELEKSFG